MSHFFVTLAVVLGCWVVPALALPAGGCLGDSLAAGGCAGDELGSLVAPDEAWFGDRAGAPLATAAAGLGDELAIAVAIDYVPLRAGWDIARLDEGRDHSSLVLSLLAELRPSMLDGLPDATAASIIRVDPASLRGGVSALGVGSGDAPLRPSSYEDAPPARVLAHLDGKVLSAIAGVSFVLVLWLAFYFTESAVLVHSRYQPHSAAKPGGSAPSLLMGDYTECTYLVWNGIVRVTKQGRFYPTWTNMQYIRAFIDVNQADTSPS